MVFSFARVSAVTGMNVADYYPDGKRWWFRLHEIGDKFHEVPAHHSAEEDLDEYLHSAGNLYDAKSPLFRSVNRRRVLTEGRMHRIEVLAVVKRRARAAGLPDRTDATPGMHPASLLISRTAERSKRRSRSLMKPLRRLGTLVPLQPKPSSLQIASLHQPPDPSDCVP